MNPQNNTKNRTPRPNRQNKDYRKREDNPQSYRFRRVLGEILRYLNTIPGKDSFATCQKNFEIQLSELITRGFTWGMAYPIPVHDTDFKQLQKKEWAAIRAIVRKQEYNQPRNTQPKKNYNRKKNYSNG